MGHAGEPLIGRRNAYTLWHEVGLYSDSCSSRLVVIGEFLRIKRRVCLALYTASFDAGD
jgi:hypothetical protein